MEPNNKSLVRHILKRAEDIYHLLMPGVSYEWLSPDLTIAQLRLLLVLHAEGPSRMSAIASTLNIALSTATGIVDKLVRKGLVVREADPQDRRLVICRLSPAGQENINNIWTSGQFHMERLLDGLTLEELHRTAGVADILFNNISRKTGVKYRGGTE